MNVLATVEIRWFFEDPPISMKDYFSTSHQDVPRTDWYALPSDLGCGIKIREGRLETKLRLDSLGDRQYQNISGALESWKKWSCELSDGEHPSHAVLRSTNWLEVHKLRSIRRFEVARDKIVETDAPPINGCSFELTMLEADQASWSTVGFESIGPNDQLESNLEKVIEFVQRSMPFPDQLRLDNSMSYVAWLNRHVREAKPTEL